MSNYVQNTNFATKDALPSGDSLKIVRGTEINTEFNNIATAVATKADTNSPTLATPTLVNPALGTPVSGNLANCTFPTLNQNTTGNAGTATALQNARTIGGVSFNGTANINLPGVNTAGNQNTSGNAATATNAIDIANGAAGSPRIVGKAAKRLADYPVLSVTAANTHSALNGVAIVDGTTTTDSQSNVVAKTVTIQLYTGSLRLKFIQELIPKSNSQYTSTADVFKNNSLLQTFNLTSSENVAVERTIDILIVPTDVIQIQHRTSQPVFGFSRIGVTTVFGSNGYTTRDLFIPALEVNNA